MPTKMRRELVHDHSFPVESNRARFANSASAPDFVVLDAGLADTCIDNLGREFDAWMQFSSINSATLRSRGGSNPLTHYLVAGVEVQIVAPDH